MDDFPFNLGAQDILIKSANLLHHWSSREPLTLMEETTYPKLIHFTFAFSLFLKLKGQPS